jgi:hypothetical protein
MFTRKELTFRTQGGMPFKVAAGTPVEAIAAEPGWFWVKPEALPANSIERHDATYYGLRVFETNVVKEPPAKEDAE